MPIDIPAKKIHAYMATIKPQRRNSVLKTICDGEAFTNAFDSDKVKIILDVIVAKIIDETTEMVNLIKKGKFKKDVELEVIRKHCISIATLEKLVEDWEGRLNAASKHFTKIEGGLKQ